MAYKSLGVHRPLLCLISAIAEDDPAEVTAVKAFPVVPSAVSGWIDAGTTHLDPGSYNAKVLLSAGAVLEKVEIAPPLGSASTNG